jgi:SEC-C motif-containing protein
MKCPCGTGAELEACCEPIIAGQRAAATAEALMRSRYSAYALERTEYLLESHDPQARADFDREATQKWAEQTEWLSLEILNTKAGGEHDDRGEVEFVARFRDDRGRELSHHERSTFVRRDGRWYFEDGELQRSPPVTRSAPKVGRNDPCPCGSGKKYKKCCGVL